MLIKSDKIIHFLAGYAITLTVGVWHPVWGLTIGVIAAAAKEIFYDKWLARGTPEWADFLYTLAGVCLAFVLAEINAYN